MTELTANEIEIYVKLVYTTRRYTYIFDKDTPIIEFIKLMNNQYEKSKFGIHSEYVIEIVETGNTVYGQAEMAPSLDHTEFLEGKTFSEKYGPNKKFLAFYIRPVNPDTGEFVHLDSYRDDPTD